jgi:hypothetical protein
MHHALLATLAALLLGGCGRGIPGDGPLARAPAPEAAQLSPATDAADDAWAEHAFALYGEAAVHTCLAAFHQALLDGDADMGLRGKPLSYRAYLAEFMCDCARGQSPQACPEP